MQGVLNLICASRQRLMLKLGWIVAIAESADTVSEIKKLVQNKMSSRHLVFVC